MRRKQWGSLRIFSQRRFWAMLVWMVQGVIWMYSLPCTRSTEKELHWQEAVSDASLTPHHRRSQVFFIVSKTMLPWNAMFSGTFVVILPIFLLFLHGKHSTTVTRCAIASCQARRRSRCAKTAARAASGRCRRRCWPGWCWAAPWDEEISTTKRRKNGKVLRLWLDLKGIVVV